MRIHNRTTRSLNSAVGRSGAMPFSGLGHDLEPTAVKAKCMNLIPLQSKAAGFCHAYGFPFVPRLHGYGLLTSLGREIRGR